jgi:hypothetical protein
MILQKLAQEAEFAAGRYTLLTESWRGAFNDALNRSDFGSPAHNGRLNHDLIAIADTFLTEEKEAARRVVEEIALEAHQTTLSEIQSATAIHLSERVLEHLGVTQSYLVDETIAQLYRDIALVRQTLRRIVLEVSVAARARRIPERAALIEYRIGNSADLQFTFHDRQSRRWSSKKFMRALWRHTLLSTYNETVMMTLADHGIEHARVFHQDGKAEVHDMRIAFGSNSSLPTYSEIRDAVFHPNANAYLTMEPLDVQA